MASLIPPPSIINRFRSVIIIIVLFQFVFITNAYKDKGEKNDFCGFDKDDRYHSCKQNFGCDSSKNSPLTGYNGREKGECRPIKVPAGGSCYYQKQYGSFKQCKSHLICLDNVCKQRGWYWSEIVLPIVLGVAALWGLRYLFCSGFYLGYRESLDILLNKNAFGTYPVREMQEEYEIQHLIGICKVEDSRPPIKSRLGWNRNCIYSKLRVYELAPTEGGKETRIKDIYNEKKSRDFYVEDELNSNAKIYVKSSDLSMYLGTIRYNNTLSVTGEYRFSKYASNTVFHHGSGSDANVPQYIRNKMTSNTNRYILSEIVEGTRVGVIGKPVKDVFAYRGPRTSSTPVAPDYDGNSKKDTMKLSIVPDNGGFNNISKGDTMKLSMVPCVEPLSKNFLSKLGWGSYEKRLYHNIERTVKKVNKKVVLYKRKQDHSNVTTGNYIPPTVYEGNGVGGEMDMEMMGLGLSESVFE